MAYTYRFKSFVRLSLALVAGCVLSGCASGARTGAMTTGVVPNAIVASNSPARNAIALGNVSGGSDTNPLWKSNVSTDNFLDALKQSLQLNVLLAANAGQYRLDAELMDLDQPFGGFDMEVTAHVHYKLTDETSQKVVFDETVVTPHTTNFSDAFLGGERLRLANEGAIHDNIQSLITKLLASPALKG